MRRRITKRVVDSLKPGEREYIVWDTDLPGFGARVRPSGKIGYLLKYRVGGGRTGTPRKPKIGTHGPITADEARTIAKTWLAEVAKGGDPGGDRMARREAPTVSAFADQYLEGHVADHNKASTARELKRLVERHIRPRLGTMKMVDVARKDVMELHRALRKTPRQANQALAVLSKMMNLAEAGGDRPDGSNPCRHVKRYRETGRERFLSAAELMSLGKALNETEADGAAEAVTAIKLLALTGCRVGEILGLSWGDVDLERGVIELADAKAGPRSVMLGAPAEALLKGLKRRSGWVVESAPGKPLAYFRLSRAWLNIREKARLGTARLHDLRHGYATAAGGLGLNAFIIRDLLGHRTLSQTGKYVEADTDPLRAAADRVAGRIAAAMEGKEAEVVDMPKRGRKKA